VYYVLKEEGVAREDFNLFSEGVAVGPPSLPSNKRWGRQRGFASILNKNRTRNVRMYTGGGGGRQIGFASVLDKN
jgi:hypothetical protein